MRQQRSGVKERKDLWEIHHDPYDMSRVWARNPDGGWITAFWKHLRRMPMPFGELAWDHARRGLPEGTEAEIADAVRDLLVRAHEGPSPEAPRGPSKRDRRVAARTQATRAALQANPIPEYPTADEADEDVAGAEDDTPTAKVIPLPVFDPFAEARKRW